MLDATLRLADGTPPAHIAAFDTDGNALHVGTHPNPLQPGQHVTCGTPSTGWWTPTGRTATRTRGSPRVT